jgi:DNA polymerase III subunit gamma/tau
MRNLANKYRPSTFSEVVGQEHMTVLLDSMVNGSGVLPSGLVFVGKAGSGKSTSARILAKAINCLSEHKPCNTCANCVMFNTIKSDGMPSYPDYLEVDAASYGGKEDIGLLLDLADRGTSVPGGRRVILLDEAHRLSREAFDILLKPLEEGMSKTVWIFATTDGDKVPAAILSRCPTFTTRPLTQKKLYGYLKMILESESLEYDEKSLTLLSYIYAGKTRDAVTELNMHVNSKGSFLSYSDKSIYEYIMDSMLRAYNKDLEGAYELVKETISFKSSNIGYDISETILALYTKNYNLVNKGVLDDFIELVGVNLSKIMNIYLNNNITNSDKFILSLCLISDLNKSTVKSIQTKRRVKTETSISKGLVEDLAGTGKFT